MQKHSRRGDKFSKRRGKPSQEKGFLKKLLDAFYQLSEPAQAIVIIGLLLVLSWLVANPLILVALLKAFLGLIAIRTTLY